MTMTTMMDLAIPTIREIKPINFLYFRTEAYLHELPNFLPVARDLHQEAVAYHLHVTGPIQWHYFGFKGDTNQPFVLEVALPVANVVPEYDGSFHFKRTEPFRCVTLQHEGPWESLGETYLKIMKFLELRNLEPVAMNREVYIHTDFQDPAANITQVQVGIL